MGLGGAGVRKDGVFRIIADDICRLLGVYDACVACTIGFVSRDKKLNFR